MLYQGVVRTKSQRLSYRGAQRKFVQTMWTPKKREVYVAGLKNRLMFWPLVFESSVLVFFIKISLVYMIIQVRFRGTFSSSINFQMVKKKRIVILKANVIRFPTCAKSFPSGLELRQLILRGLLQDYYWALRALFPNFHWMTMTNMPTCMLSIYSINSMSSEAQIE